VRRFATSPSLLHVSWLAMPLTVGLAMRSALDSTSAPVAVVLQVLAWAAWAAGVVAIRVPRTVGLTALRVVAPAAVVAAAWAAVRHGVTGGELVALAWSAATAGLVLLAPGVADHLADGSSYGDEARFTLRTPPALLLGPVELVWAVIALGVAAGPLLLAARAWTFGALAVAVGYPAAYLGVRALHRLSRRWLVFVPAGIVVHDHLTLAEPVLFPRRLLLRFGPAPAGTAETALDLTGGAAGLVLELCLTEPVELALAGRRPPEERTIAADRLLVTPSRPGAVGREAQRRRTAPQTL
jgi:hypothetical protein